MLPVFADAQELHKLTRPGNIERVRVFVILDDRTSPDHPLGDAVETFIRREDPERFLEDVRGDDEELARGLRVVERGISRPAA